MHGRALTISDSAGGRARRLTRLYSLLLLLGVLAACAQPIRLQPLSPYANVGFVGGLSRPVHVVLPLEDERSAPECDAGPETLEGSERVYDHAHWQLGCSDLPPRWVGDRLVTGLSAAGFEVLDAPAFEALPDAARGDVFVVEGSVRMFTGEVMSQMQSVLAEFDIQVHLRVTHPSGLEATRTFHVKEQSSGLSSGNAALNGVIGRGSDRMVVDTTAAILSLANRFAFDDERAGMADAARAEAPSDAPEETIR